MAERVVDRCEDRLDRKPTPSLTAGEPLPGGDFEGSIEKLCSRLESLGMPKSEAERAVRLYGNEALDLFESGNAIAAEVRQAGEVEGALTLEDYWVRRSARARFEADDGIDALNPAAEHMSGPMRWTDEDRHRQMEHCMRLRAEELGAYNEAPAK